MQQTHLLVNVAVGCLIDGLDHFARGALPDVRECSILASVTEPALHITKLVINE